jgi:hypothetical protein
MLLPLAVSIILVVQVETVVAMLLLAVQSASVALVVVVKVVLVESPLLYRIVLVTASQVEPVVPAARQWHQAHWLVKVELAA